MPFVKYVNPFEATARLENLRAMFAEKPIRGKLSLVGEWTEDQIKVLRDFPEVVESQLLGILREFVRDRVVARLHDEYSSKAIQDHIPIFTKEIDGTYAEAFARAGTPAANTVLGFQNLQHSLERSTVEQKRGRGVFAGVGPADSVLRHKLYEYGPIGGKGTGMYSFSSYNNWFYAVEFGTGVEENIGNMSYVRTYGPGKHPSRDGSWFLGGLRAKKNEVMGLRFFGQRGFHLFWDPSNSRRPQAYWTKMFTEELPVFITERLKTFAT